MLQTSVLLQMPVPNPAPIRVAIADDSLLIREGLRQILALEPLIEVVGMYGDAPSLLAAIDEISADVVLTDLRMPPTLTDEGMQIAERLRRTHPQVGVVLLSQHESSQYAAQLVSDGSSGRGYLLKDRIHDMDQLLATVRAVANGDCCIDPILIDGILGRQRKKSNSVIGLLTPRQCEIIALIASGKSNLAISEELSLTQRAVEKHVNEIFSRLGLATDETINRRVRATLLYLSAKES